MDSLRSAKEKQPPAPVLLLNENRGIILKLTYRKDDARIIIIHNICMNVLQVIFFFHYILLKHIFENEWR